jgi:hypothetical protein
VAVRLPAPVTPRRTADVDLPTSGTTESARAQATKPSTKPALEAPGEAALATRAGSAPRAQHSSPQLDPFNLPTNPVSAVTAAFDVGHWNRTGAKLVTASDVDGVLAGDLGQALPHVPPALHGLVRSLAQALGRDGPLGSHGPLGKLGPVADEPWSPSFWMNKVGDWSDLSKKLAEHGGPGSAAGPLGDRGPLGPALKNLDGPLLEELRAGGLFAPLGPLGPLGALGALGYLGLVGGHGYARNEDGNFVDKTGKVVRHASVLDAGGKNKSFELVELFPEQSAKALRIHDASWAIRGAIGKDEADGDTFRFAAKKGQVITLTVVPESAGDTMTVELLQKGKVIARSESDKLVNWIHLEADRSGTLEVRVRKKEGASAPAPHPASMFIDAMLSPLVMWGEAVRPWVGAPKRESGAGYRLYSTSTPPAQS